jgi:hypothetical protein
VNAVPVYPDAPWLTRWQELLRTRLGAAKQGTHLLLVLNQRHQHLTHLHQGRTIALHGEHAPFGVHLQTRGKLWRDVLGGPLQAPSEKAPLGSSSALSRTPSVGNSPRLRLKLSCQRGSEMLLRW